MTTTDSGRMISLLGLDPARYEPHFLHGSSRGYPETNCYTDSLIEFVHAIGSEPLAMMGCALPVDFEGDQWTFFKPRPEDVEALFGIDIHEMQPYRPLPDQIAEQIEAGRTLAVEVDSFHLPDTAATDYRRNHVKSSVVAEAIDREGECLRYFHGSGYHELEGEDYREILRVDLASFAPDVLPPYAELLRTDAGRRLEGGELRARAREMLERQVARRPADNPFDRFGTSLEAALPGLLAGDIAEVHGYVFPTARMVGSAFEVGASHVEWVLGDDGIAASAAMREIATGAKTLSFKLARRREFDPAPTLAAFAGAWSTTFAELDDVLG